MPNKVLEKVLLLTSAGYEIRIRPDILNDSIEFRLTKDNHNVAQIVRPEACQDSYVWKTDEEWFLYILTRLEWKFEDYVKRLKETQNDSI